MGAQKGQADAVIQSFENLKNSVLKADPEKIAKVIYVGTQKIANVTKVEKFLIFIHKIFHLRNVSEKKMRARTMFRRDSAKRFRRRKKTKR